MRTTIDIRDDLMSELQNRAARDKATLKDEVNVCLERGLGLSKTSQPDWKARTYAMGRLCTKLPF